eukprot:1194756-Prorocentrum_minimum.AAC.1
MQCKIGAGTTRETKPSRIDKQNQQGCTHYPRCVRGDERGVGRALRCGRHHQRGAVPRDVLRPPPAGVALLCPPHLHLVLQPVGAGGRDQGGVRPLTLRALHAGPAHER